MLSYVAQLEKKKPLLQYECQLLEKMTCCMPSRLASNCDLFSSASSKTDTGSIFVQVPSKSCSPLFSAVYPYLYVYSLALDSTLSTYIDLDTYIYICANVSCI